LWSLSPIGPDDLLIDNDYRSWPQIRGRDALLVARPRGEMFLDDSVFHLKSSLEVLGYQVQRVDQISEFEAQSKAPQLIVAEASPTAQLGTFCPIFATHRSSQEKGREDLSVWLVPGQELSDYGELCYCFAALVQAPKPLAARPAYCENIEHRDQYVGILQSIGAMQLGGAIDSPLASVAMSIRNKELGMRVLGFTSPLNPMRAGQLSYGQLPLLLRAVFQATGVKIGKNQEKQQDWPRIDDISAAYDLPNLALSNVPMRESLGRQASLDQLPAQLSLGAKGLVRQQSMGGSENDARPWIYLCLLLVVLSLWLEIIGFGLSRIFRRHRWVLRWFVIIISLCLAPDKAESGVKLNLLGYGSVPKLNSLMKEVAGRTSIELEEQTVGQLNFHRDIMREPWLWVARPEILEALEARDFSELTAWLQRGGFLVVENHSGSEKLKRTILEAAPTGSWKPIPPDHELMRSFHLLASLPQCQNQVWEGFHFDQRIALVLIPGEFLRYTLDERSPGHCFDKYSHEQAVRV
ncbi:MAG: DUF4159 domain-containing protein, partial [Proteobacteria bacterium]|nr:DUF4159 domain-containing protein [Pseudomonadota bacterium]